MSTEQALLTAMRDAEEGDTRAHRVYADWLVDCGREAEARPIRAGCDLADCAPEAPERLDLAVAATRELPEVWEPLGELVGARVLYSRESPERLHLYRRHEAVGTAFDGALESLPTHAPRLEALSLARLPLLPRHLASLGALQGLRSLVASIALPDVVDRLADLPRLEQLELNEAARPPLAALAATPLAERLRGLTLHSLVSRDEARALASFPALRALSLRGQSEPGAPLALAAPLLERLELPWANDPSPLPDLPALRHLRLEVVADQSADALRDVLAGVPQLTSLDLALRRIPERLILDLGQLLPHLRCLRLGPHRHARSLGITDATIRRIASALPGLRELSLKGEELPALDFSALASLELRALRLVSGGAPPTLPTLAHLEELSIADSRLDGPALERLAAQPRLQQLLLRPIGYAFQTPLPRVGPALWDLNFGVTRAHGPGPADAAGWAKWVRDSRVRRLALTVPARALRDLAPDVIIDDHSAPTSARVRIPGVEPDF